MRAVMLEVPQALFDERRVKCLDRSDEMWDGGLLEPAVGEAPGVTAETVDAKLRLAWEGGSAEI